VSRGAPRDRLVVASPVPVAFWNREIKWRANNRYGQGRYSLTGGLDLPLNSSPINLSSYQQAAIAKTGDDAQAFLFWSRMPYAEISADGTAVVRDQRFDASPARSNFELTVKPR
jgi:inner membrane protein